MNQRPTQITRFHIIAALSLALLCVYLVVLFNIQVVHHEDYLARTPDIDRDSRYAFSVCCCVARMLAAKPA